MGVVIFHYQQQWETRKQSSTWRMTTVSSGPWDLPSFPQMTIWIDKPAKYLTNNGLDFTRIDAPPPQNLSPRLWKTKTRASQLSMSLVKKKGLCCMAAEQSAWRHPQNQPQADWAGGQVLLHLGEGPQLTAPLSKQTQWIQTPWQAMPPCL